MSLIVWITVVLVVSLLLNPESGALALIIGLPVMLYFAT